jgi:hypothetical protein
VTKNFRGDSGAPNAGATMTDEREPLPDYVAGLVEGSRSGAKLQPIFLVSEELS